MHTREDWSTNEDFDLEDAEWIDITTVASSAAGFEEQLEVYSSIRRHRVVSPKGPWVKGPAPLPEKSKTLLNGVESIAAERKRQVEKEGWTPEHDDKSHDPGDLAAAAFCYALAAADSLNPYSQGDGVDPENPPDPWPFDRTWWKPDLENPRRDLVRAGALIAAEIDRLDREALKRK